MGRREVSLAPWMGIPDRSTCSLRGKAGVMMTSGAASAPGEGEGPVESGMGTAGAGGEGEAS